MINVVSLALLAAGSNLTLIGINAYTSAGSDISRLKTVSPTKKVKLMLIGSVVITVIGVVGLLSGPKAK
jgi:hypothetical protein